ncbi:MAG: aminotransferase class I/II-fold pyridoxal phosphate-dependent enzyme [Bacteroidetes bacterium]|nr:aminotransferase class I/II-fold pyridoxal phosphate-dependent enzyme [Bacteroidota bacterium]
MSWDAYLNDRLAALRQAGLYRQLEPPLPGADFYSNDYLGLARDPALHSRLVERIRREPLLGAKGSRLIGGNSPLAEEVEQDIARFHRAEAALLFGSGYLANIGLFAALTTRQDTILYDAAIHASMRDGIRLSLAHAHSFRHNDLEDLRQKLTHARGNVLIATEGLFSMDGDQAPLAALADLCAQSGARLVVDEAHSGGILGPEGAGLAAAPAIAPYCLARIYTFGKALGYHGAGIVGSRLLRETLVNLARSFIYTTALPPHSLLAIQEVYRHLPDLSTARAQLQQQIARLQEGLAARGIPYLGGEGPIFAIPIPGNTAVQAVSAQLLPEARVKAIRSPTVPPGTERLRICLHSCNTEAEIAALLNRLGSILTKNQ